MKEFLGSPEFLDECVMDILDQHEGLLPAAINAVAARLPKSAFNDLAWCKAVVDVTVEEVLSTFDVDMLVQESVSNVSAKVMSSIRTIKPRYSTSEPDQNIMNRKNSLAVKSPPSPPVAVGIIPPGKFSSPQQFIQNEMSPDKANSMREIPFDDSSSEFETTQGQEEDEISDDSLGQDTSSSSVQKIGGVYTKTIGKGRRNVKFNPSPVSDTLTFEKFSKAEAQGLFYSHDDALKFQADFERETWKASRAGKSWIDWINSAPEDELDDSVSDEVYNSDEFSDDELEFNEIEYNGSVLQDDGDRDEFS